MKDSKTLIDDLKNIVKDFVEEREWGQFHNPKNLSMEWLIKSFPFNCWNCLGVSLSNLLEFPALGMITLNESINLSLLPLA